MGKFETFMFKFKVLTAKETLDKMKNLEKEIDAGGLNISNLRGLINFRALIRANSFFSKLDEFENRTGITYNRDSGDEFAQKRRDIVLQNMQHGYDNYGLCKKLVRIDKEFFKLAKLESAFVKLLAYFHNGEIDKITQEDKENIKLQINSILETLEKHKKFYSNWPDTLIDGLNNAQNLQDKEKYEAVYSLRKSIFYGFGTTQRRSLLRQYIEDNFVNTLYELKNYNLVFILEDMMYSVGRIKTYSSALHNFFYTASEDIKWFKKQYETDMDVLKGLDDEKLEYLGINKEKRDYMVSWYKKILTTFNYVNVKSFGETLETIRNFLISLDNYNDKIANIDMANITDESYKKILNIRRDVFSKYQEFANALQDVNIIQNIADYLYTGQENIQRNDEIRAINNCIVDFYKVTRPVEDGTIQNLIERNAKGCNLLSMFKNIPQGSITPKGMNFNLLNIPDDLNGALLKRNNFKERYGKSVNIEEAEDYSNGLVHISKQMEYSLRYIYKLYLEFLNARCNEVNKVCIALKTRNIDIANDNVKAYVETCLQSENLPETLNDFERVLQELKEDKKKFEKAKDSLSIGKFYAMLTQTDAVFGKQNFGKVSNSFIDFVIDINRLNNQAKQIPELPNYYLSHYELDKLDKRLHILQLESTKVQIMISDWLSNIRLYEMSRNNASHDYRVTYEEFKNALNVGLFSTNSVLRTASNIFGDAIEQDRLVEQSKDKQKKKNDDLSA